jgi:hypothetical protein
MYGIAKGGAQRRQPVLTGIVVNNFNFNFKRATALAKGNAAYAIAANQRKKLSGHSEF